MPDLQKYNFRNSADYSNLFDRVKKVLIEGQARIEQERVRTYWETGQLIHAHILEHKDRGEYGTEVIRRLADDLGINLRLLQRCIQFAKTYRQLPKVSGRTLFTWSHYRELISVPDKKRRLQIENRAVQKGWTAEELAFQVKKERPQEKEYPAYRQDSSPVRPLIPSRGELYTYQIVERPTVGEGGSGLLVDLGFGTFHDADSRQLSSFGKNDIIESHKKDDKYRFSKSGRTAKDLYTYAAYVEKIIDGDTLKVRIDLGFSVWSRQVLRLRGIDCPELNPIKNRTIEKVQGIPRPEGVPVGRAKGDARISANAGQSAKVFVQSYIKEADRIVIRSSRSDKYDRYLADVYIPRSSSADLERTVGISRPQGVGITTSGEGKEEIYLNKLLLEKGHAVRWE